MSCRQLVQYSFLTIGLAVYAYQLIQDVPIDLQNISDDCLNGVIESDEMCDITVKNRRLLIRNDSLTMEILKAKFDTFFSKNYFYRYLSDQVQCLHIIDEALLVKRFVISACFMTFCMFVIEFFVVRRMGNLIRSYRNLKRLETEEYREWSRCVRDFAAEKLIVLVFCVVRSYSRVNHKHYIDFGDYVRDCFALRSKSTDITIFACWYCILAICHVSTNSIFRRYILTIPLLERRLMTRLRTQNVFIIIFLTCSSFVALSGILLGFSIVSFAFLHPDYSTILLLESFRAFIRSLYVLERLAMSVSSTCMNGIEEQTKLTDEETATIIARGFQRQNRWNARRVYALTTLVISFLLNIFYALTGLIFNRKVLAVGFLLTANQIVNDIANIDEYDPTQLL